MRWVSGLLGLVLVGSVLSAAEPTFTTAQRSWWSLQAGHKTSRACRPKSVVGEDAH